MRAALALAPALLLTAPALRTRTASRVVAKSSVQSSISIDTPTLLTSNADDIPSLLIMSSPTEAKVCYSEISDFKSAGNNVMPLIDAGLSGPYGIAFDGGGTGSEGSTRSALYVADMHGKKIVRYDLKARECSEETCKVRYELSVDGMPVNVLEGVSAEWVAVDDAGNLYFTDKETKSVNKLAESVINQILQGSLAASSLRRLDEQQAEAVTAAQTADGSDRKLGATDNSVSLATSEGQSVVALYQEGQSLHVGVPGGVALGGGGEELYWTNQADGLAKGSVVRGQPSPAAPIGLHSGSRATEFPSYVVANNTATAYGVAAGRGVLVYGDEKTSVYGARVNTGVTVVLNEEFELPRGIVFDGDNTMYVADNGGNAVFTLPIGALQPVSKSRVVDLKGPWGVALIKSTDRLLGALKDQGMIGAGDERSSAPPRVDALSACALAAVTLAAWLGAVAAAPRAPA